MTQLLDPETAKMHGVHNFMSAKLREMFPEYMPYCQCEYCREFRALMPGRE